MINDPVLHTHVDDCLPDDHPLALEQVYCDCGCCALLHACNNECMQTWVEAGCGNYALSCFVRALEGEGGTQVVEDRWGIRS